MGPEEALSGAEISSLPHWLSLSVHSPWTYGKVSSLTLSFAFLLAVLPSSLTCPHALSSVIAGGCFASSLSIAPFMGFSYNPKLLVLFGLPCILLWWHELLTTVFILLHVILLAQLTLSMWCELVSSLSSLSSEGSLICLCAIVLCAFCPLLSVEYQEVWEDLQPLHFGSVLSECCWWYTFKSKNSAEALTEFAHWNTYIVHLHDLSLWSHVSLTCASVPLSFIYCCIDFVM